SRGFQLLALPDVDLLISLLDYLYSITCTSSISLSICSDFPSIQSIIKLLIFHLQHQCTFELGPIQSLPIPSSKWYYERPKTIIPIKSNSSNPPHQTHHESNRGPPQTPTMTEVHKILLEDDEIGQLAYTSEPKRARDWMLKVFESDPNGEIQQVTLWLAYKTQFEAYLNKPPSLSPDSNAFNSMTAPSMIAPAEAIKLTSEVFPTACPSVQEVPNGEKKFIIKGIKARERIAPSDLLSCKWEECKERSISGGPQEVYQHILIHHLSSLTCSESEGFQCKWLRCEIEKRNLIDLKSHLLTHLIPNSSQPKEIGRVEKAKFESFQTFKRNSPHGDLDEHGAMGMEEEEEERGRRRERDGDGDGDLDGEERVLGLRVLRVEIEKEMLKWGFEDVWLSGLACEVLGWLDLIYKRIELKSSSKKVKK
ncbi:hypothetical protein DFH28DRAFT_1177157, partial [Melampsora americana]